MSPRTLIALVLLGLLACSSSDEPNVEPAPEPEEDAGIGGQAGSPGEGGAAGSAGGGVGGSQGGSAGQGGNAGTSGKAGAAGQDGGTCKPFSTAGRTWAITEVDYIGGAPIYPDIALLPDGNPVTVFTKGDATSRWAAVSRFDGSAWGLPEEVEKVAGVYLGKRPSVAVEGSGTLHVVSYDEDKGDVRYGVRPAAGTWSVETIYDALADAGDHSSLFLDGEGRLHLTFLEYGTYRVIYGMREQGAWSALQPIATGSGPVKGSSTAVSADAQGNARVAYYTGTPSSDLRFARREAGGWVEELVDGTEDVGHYPSLVIDEKGTEWISYLRWPVEQSEMRVASREGGTWKVRTLATGLGITYTTGMVRLPCGGIAASWGRNEGVGTPGLWFGYWAPGDADFTLISVDPSTYVSGVAMAADPEGVVHIVFLDETNYILKHAMLPLAK